MPDGGEPRPSRELGLNVVLQVSDTPLWARQSRCDELNTFSEANYNKNGLPIRGEPNRFWLDYCAPSADHVDEWAAFVHVATCLLAAGDAVQIGNEPNSQAFSGGSRQYFADPAGRTFIQGMPPAVYFDRIFDPALRRLQADPARAGIVILAGGLASRGFKVPTTKSRMRPTRYPRNNYWVWLDRFLRVAEDAVPPRTGFRIAQHMYPDPKTEQNGQGGMPTAEEAESDLANIYDEARRVANIDRPARPERNFGPIWVTEVGISTDPRPSRDLKRPRGTARYQYARQTQLDALRHVFCDVVSPSAPFIIFKLIDNLRTDSSNNETFNDYVAGVAGFGTMVYRPASKQLIGKPIPSSPTGQSVAGGLRNAASATPPC